MPGRKNKSYKLGLYIPKSFQDNQPALDNSYSNFGFRDSGQYNDFPLDKNKAQRKLPPIPTDMDNRTRMSISDKKTLVNPVIENRRNSISNSLGIVPAETRPQGYQTTHNPIYDSSTTTLNSESSPTLVRRALSSTDESSLDQVSQNMEEMSLEIPSELANKSTQNPLYHPDISESVKSQGMPNQLTVVATVESDYFSQKTNLQSSLEENDEPFIPEPDYDEDEITIDFKNEDCDQVTSSINSGTLLYKDYEGEDFGQYISDEEEHIENLGYTWRKNIRHNYPRQDHSRKAKTEVKRQRLSSQRSAQKLFKSAPKMKGSTMRQNLREFSFADAKISLANTVSQVYNNRYKKNTEVTAEDEQFLRSRHSYEQFLHNRFSQSFDGESQNWSQKEYEKHRHYEKSLGLDFTGKLSRRFKNGKDALVGRLTTKFRRKSDSSYQIPED